jgi:hypothetical protein
MEGRIRVTSSIWKGIKFLRTPGLGLALYGREILELGHESSRISRSPPFPYKARPGVLKNSLPYRPSLELGQESSRIPFHIELV